MHERAALITSFNIFIEDHGILTFMIYVDYDDGGSQGAGGYALDYNEDGERKFSPATGKLIRYMLESFDVERLDQLKGKPCFTIMQSDDWNSKIIGLRPFRSKNPLIFSEMFPKSE